MAMKAIFWTFLGKGATQGCVFCWNNLGKHYGDCLKVWKVTNFVQERCLSLAIILTIIPPTLNIFPIQLEIYVEVLVNLVYWVEKSHH